MSSRRTLLLATFAGSLFLPVLWLVLKYYFGISDRYLPSPGDVISSVVELEPNFFWHSLITAIRCLIGLVVGILFGLLLGILANKNVYVRAFLLPPIQAIRSSPAIGFLVFFLLWFGFSDVGKILLIMFGIGFNIAVAVDQILQAPPEKYQIMFRSFGKAPSQFLVSFCLPFAVGELLPTLRFSLATTIGVVVVAEMLGSQEGLGYLIQTSRSTFSMHTIFLAVAMLGILNVALDRLLVLAWKLAVYWRQPL